MRFKNNSQFENKKMGTLESAKKQQQTPKHGAQPLNFLVTWSLVLSPPQKGNQNSVQKNKSNKTEKEQ